MLSTQPSPQPLSPLCLTRDVATGFCDGVFHSLEALTVVFPDPVSEVPTCGTTDCATMDLMPVFFSVNLLVPLTNDQMTKCGFSNR